MTASPPSRRSAFWLFIKTHFTKIFWIIGVVSSGIQPFIKPPLGTSHPFYIGALFSGIVGYALMASVSHAQRIPIIVKWIITFFLVILLIVSLNEYNDLLNDPRNSTPSATTLNIEEFWYCLFYFCALAVFSFIFDKGGRYLISLFSPKTGP